MVYLLIWTDNIGAVAVQAYDTEELRNEARDRRLDPRRMCGYTAFNLMPVSDSHARLVEEF